MYNFLPLNEKVANFEKLPMSCKEFFFKIITVDYAVNFKQALPEFIKNTDFSYSNCKDGYDTFFNFVYDLFIARFSEDVKSNNFELMNFNDYSDGEKTEFSFELITTPRGRFISGKETDTKLLVSLHGYDEYARVGNKPDAEKDKQLKNCGYDIIRFSERELYANPIKCVMDFIDTFNDIAGIRKKDD